MSVHIFGIRHHGPGSCRNVAAALSALHPDLILLEGPVEAEELVDFAADEQMKPPVAMLAYQTDKPSNAVFYPFAVFSPEWQTIRYALKNDVVLRFFDLPLAYSMALEKVEDSGCDDRQAVPSDPFDSLAVAAGYSDGESWWEAEVEQRKDTSEIFQAVQEAVTALREEFPGFTSERDRLREAWMRKVLRMSQKEPFERIAVVCGAWHAPALTSLPKVKDDNELLKGLSKVKIECTWIPWTYDRLTLRSGYGAGIAAPGWYHHLWHHPDDDGTLWLSHVASLLRKRGMDISVAHVIEAVKLANATAALRNLHSPSLEEYNEAVTTVMGFGDDMLLRIVKEELVVGDRLGCVPENVPKVPLLTDFEKAQKRLRVPFTAEIKDLTLDLRKPTDLDRSIFFHRLSLLGIDWAVQGSDGSGRGTFKERWTLYHRPEQIVTIIERAIWGNTIKEASGKYVSDKMSKVVHIPELTKLLDRVIPADLPDLVEAMTVQLDRLSAASTDILEMMQAIPDLAGIVRYGDVRKLDFSQVGNMLRGMIARILAGGVLVCININEEAATEVCGYLAEVDYAVAMLDDSELAEMWMEFVDKVRTTVNVHPMLAGYATRLLSDKGIVSSDEAADALNYNSSAGNAPVDTAYWFEGFLRSSGSVLLLDDNLWGIVHGWICGLDREAFNELLPIMRRTFGDYTVAERRRLGEKARTYMLNGGAAKLAVVDSGCNDEEAQRVLPVVCRLLGLEI